MEFDFRDALDRLGPDAPITVAREVRPSANYAFNSILPEREMTGYIAENGTMTIRSTMAGLVGMDSPYPPGGFQEADDFMARIAKIANEVTLGEKAQREIQERLRRLDISSSQNLEALMTEALNFLTKAVIQPHLDTAEYLRGQALNFGALDWTFNGIRLQVDYGIPADHFLPTQTGTTGYGGPDSAFWADIRSMRRKLRYNVDRFIAHPDTIDMIVNNPANNLAIITQSGFDFKVQKLIESSDGRLRESTDAMDTMMLSSYQLEGEILDPTNPRNTLIIPFMPLGKILAIGKNQASGYRVGEGSTPDPRADEALGYTHIGPTVEGGGSLGRWSDLFTPERKKFQLVGQGVSNVLPVLEAPEKLAIATTEMV